MSTFGEAPYAAQPGYANRWRGLIFIGISLIVISLNNTVLNVALPSIARSLNATATELQWIVDAYVLVFAALLLTTGSISDRIGRKKALQIGLAMFGIGSLAAALSTSTLMLIATRAFLGIGGATIMPSMLSLISASFPPHERPQAIALWAAVHGLGVGVGPLVGGWLVLNFSWNSVFFINLPVIAVALVGSALFLSESKDEHAPKPDIPGVILSIIGLFALVYAIIEAGVQGWTHDSVLIASAVAFVALGVFVWWERHTPNAMLPMRFFRNMSFTGANLALVLLSFSLFGAIFFLTQYLQTIHGYTAFEAGIRILPQAVALTLASTFSARIARRIGMKFAIALGLAFSGVAMFYMSQIFDVETPYSVIVVGQVMMTTGLGLAISPATNSVMGSVPVSKAGIGSAMNDMTRQLGGAIGIAVLGTILNSHYLHGVEPLRGQLAPDVFAQVASSVQRAHLVAAGSQLPAALSERITETAKHAFMTGMSNALLVAAAVMVASALFVLVALPAQIRRPQESETVRAEVPAPAPAPLGD